MNLDAVLETEKNVIPKIASMGNNKINLGSLGSSKKKEEPPKEPTKEKRWGYGSDMMIVKNNIQSISHLLNSAVAPVQTVNPKIS